jgi:hypothetical protein
MRGGIFLRKMPLGFLFSVKNRIETAVSGPSLSGVQKAILIRGWPFARCNDLVLACQSVFDVYACEQRMR